MRGELKERLRQETRGAGAFAKRLMRKMFWSSPRHKLITIGTALTVLGVADFTYGAKEVTQRGWLAPSHSYHVKLEPCATPECKKTEQAIVAAVDLWKSLPVKRDIWSIPSYLNTRYALRAAGMETDLDSLSRDNSQFEGLFQFSCTNKRLLLHHRIKAVTNVLNAARSHVPALQKFQGDTITAGMLCDKKNREIFLDPTVQTLVKMETVLIAAKEIEDKYPTFSSLSEYQKHSLLYLSHNLPVMVRTVMKYYMCDWPVADLIPAQRSNFRANSGVYANGAATPAELLARISNFTEPYIKDHQSWMPFSRGPHHVSRWGEYGISHLALGKASDFLSCPLWAIDKKPRKSKRPKLAPKKKAEIFIPRAA